MLTRTADEWEVYLQSKHVPAARVRALEEALADPHIASRNVVHHFPDGAPGMPGPFGVPVAAFKLAHGGPRVDSPPPVMGTHTDSILAELGYAAGDIAKLRAAKVI
jgi:crotonobetainyl-CoA:carnitine CoA-transferase CaiB-like acyl-CoA transferase